MKINKRVSANKSSTPKWFYLISISLPLVLVVLTEVFLRSIDYGYNYQQWVELNNERLIINPNIGKKYFPSGNFIPNTIEDSFDKVKKENAFRVFVLGGSSAEGYPFNPMGSFSRYLRKRLELSYPHSKIEVINVSMTAINSYTILDLLPGVIEEKPDLVLIYAGHNEYYGAMGVGSAQKFGSSRTLNRIILYLNNYRLTQLVRNTLQKVFSFFVSKDEGFSGTLMSKMAAEKHIEKGSDLFYLGIEQFTENLKDILEYTKKNNVPIILGRVASNLKDQKPFISNNIDSNKNAEKIYNMAWSEYNKQNLIKAESLFVVAKDLDLLRFRAPEEINKVISRLGNEYKVPVVAIDSIFNKHSDGGIVGNNLIIDHLHPNIKGYQVLGKSFYNEMQKNNYLPSNQNPAISFEKQDSITCNKFVFTKLDSVLGTYFVKLLKSDWPYTKVRTPISQFTSLDFYNLFKPKSFIDSIAMIRIENKVSWVEAHLIAATYYLRKDNLHEYLNYMNVLITQYPQLINIDNAIEYFAKQNKIKKSDFTPRRKGVLALYIGNYKNAIKYLSEALQNDSTSSFLYYNLSLAYYNIKEYSHALKIVDKSISINNKFYEAKELKQKILAVQNDKHKYN